MNKDVFDNMSSWTTNAWTTTTGDTKELLDYTIDSTSAYYPPPYTTVIDEKEEKIKNLEDRVKKLEKVCMAQLKQLEAFEKIKQ